MGRLWWGTTVLPLSCCHIKCVASPLQQSLTIKKRREKKEKEVEQRQNYCIFWAQKTFIIQ